MNIEDTIRREQFYQIKSEIRGSDQHLVVGIDVAKDKHHAFMGSATGKSLLRKLVFENNLEGFRKLQERSEAISIRNNVLAQYFPELDRFYSACESESLAIVRWCLDPSTISCLEFDEFFSMVTTARRGIAQKLRLQKIHRLAVESVGCPMGPAAEFEATLLVDKLKYVRRQLKEIAALMEDFCMEFSEYSWLLTIPGFGPYIAARVLASISNPWRFDSSNQVIMKKNQGFDPDYLSIE